MKGFNREKGIAHHGGLPERARLKKKEKKKKKRKRDEVR